jgi:hypothetical protein
VTVALEPGETRRCRPPDPIGADRADQEDRAGDHEREQHGDGRVVQQIQVVHQQHQAVVAGDATQLCPGAVEQAGPLVVADTETTDQRGGEQMSERAERDRLHRLVPDCTCRRTTGPLGLAQRVLGDAGLAHAGLAVDHDAARAALAVVAMDRIQLRRATGQGPEVSCHRLAPTTRIRAHLREITPRSTGPVPSMYVAVCCTMRRRHRRRTTCSGRTVSA